MSTANEDAIHAELVTASGLTGDRIIYENQNNDQLGAGEMITLFVGGSKDLSPATPIETERDNPADPPVAGEEILIGTQSDSEFMLRVMYYSPTATGDASAPERLKQLVKKLSLYAVTVRLAAARIGFIECMGGVRSVPVVLETLYESRAVADLRFRTLDGVEAPETYIETAEFFGTYT